MSGPPGTAGECTVRPAGSADLERTIELDRAYSGQSRRGFFEKRWASMARDADAFISLVAEHDGATAGFVLAHLIDGEFGEQAPAAVLDAIAVDREAADRGVGGALMRTLSNTVRERGARELRTQARWDERDLVQFFARSGFRLAPRVVLERDTATPRW